MRFLLPKEFHYAKNSEFSATDLILELLHAYGENAPLCCICEEEGARNANFKSEKN